MKKILKTTFFIVVLLFTGYYIFQMVIVFSPSTDIFAPR